MKLLKKITILLCFLSLIAFVSCSAEDKSGVKEKDNADGTEITGGGKSGNSGTGGSAGTGEGSGTGGGTETTETGNFPPPAGTYRDDNVWNTWHDTSDDTKVSKLDENTTRITGRSKITSGNGGGQAFGFDISKWKKTIKDGKESKYEAVDIVVETGYNFTDISIVYYYDSSTLEITFKSKSSSVDDCLFKGTKISE
ncbi:hypothetical protein EPJ79_07375 [Brachyspira aalborgi]|uniref:Lipoprotein n=1 Tax=Brachyspira aalborgi TaxID=29522 RepID=A0A5C8D8Z0_9SPIR|nr:hypothetical protein [Brachyspira aalborgi]TXJ20941.1 hypothetical protein EPJ79_07375 [Brachyspira aalborgi]